MLNQYVIFDPDNNYTDNIVHLVVSRCIAHSVRYFYNFLAVRYMKGRLLIEPYCRWNPTDIFYTKYTTHIEHIQIFISLLKQAIVFQKLYGFVALSADYMQWFIHCHSTQCIVGPGKGLLTFYIIVELPSTQPKI